MKLLMCLKCGDVFNLTYKEKCCNCGHTKGRYVDQLNAEYYGNAQPIGFANTSFKNALTIQRIEDREQCNTKETCCEGVKFEAFFIPKAAMSLIKKD